MSLSSIGCSVIASQVCIRLKLENLMGFFWGQARCAKKEDVRILCFFFCVEVRVQTCKQRVNGHGTTHKEKVLELLSCWWRLWGVTFHTKVFLKCVKWFVFCDFDDVAPVNIPKSGAWLVTGTHLGCLCPKE